LNLPDNELTARLGPQDRQQSLTVLLLVLLEASAVRHPLLLVLEDAHWLDALSGELALQLARGLQVAGAPFLLLLVMRPQREPPPAAVALKRLPHSQALNLTALPPEAITALLDGRLGVPEEDLPPNLVELVQRRAEGNPFYAEELLLNLKAHGVIVVESDPDPRRARCRLTTDLDWVARALPGSLQGVILARIDRLPPRQQVVLKLAAVIGRSFAYPPLHHLCQHYQADQVAELAAQIASLERTDLILLEQLEPELTYLFKHIIIREVAYDSLLYEQRRPLHRRVAAWYEATHEEDGADSPYLPLLVHHYHQAEEQEKERY